MRNIPDKTGRFPQRPHYDPRELDQDCERAITDFMNQSCGGFTFPIPTDALTRLIERDAEDLDLYADLSAEGSEIQGVTDFFPGNRPRVRIAASLSEQRSENRLRTTLTHEWGHVRFHNYLWQMVSENPTMHAQLASQPSPKCKRDLILGASEVDWMEWQAGYVCGSVLMPLSHLQAVVRTFTDSNAKFTPFVHGSPLAQGLIEAVTGAFSVSSDAARVRLTKLKFLTSIDPGPSLF